MHVGAVYQSAVLVHTDDHSAGPTVSAMPLVMAPVPHPTSSTDIPGERTPRQTSVVASRDVRRSRIRGSD